jgi:hypothetical protein
MLTNRNSGNEFERAVESWRLLMSDNQVDLSGSLSDLELSALASWPSDCFDSIAEIVRLLNEIKQRPQLDKDLLHQSIVDIFWQLDHVRNHIDDAKNGFIVLMNFLGGTETK